MTDLPGRIAAVIATRRTACDEDERVARVALIFGSVAERRAYLTALENIAAMHAECVECGPGKSWPCPTLGYVAAALGISP